MVSFKKASKAQARLRMAIVGPSGGGKTYTALAIASALGKRVAVLDTERGSASKYADLFSFDVAELASFSPVSYVEGIQAAARAGFDVLVIDSFSHAWMGKDGALEQVDNAAKRSSSGNKYAAWREVTPMHNALIDAILQSPMHVIVTMRTKTEYVLETNERGKQVPRKIGTQPIQRDGVEYEFDVVADVEQEHHDLIIGKTRCSALDGKVFRGAGADVAKILSDWLTDGTEAPPVAIPTPPASTPAAKSQGVTVAAVELTIAAMLHNATDIGHVAAADKAAILAKRDGALTAAALNRLRDARAIAVARLSVESARAAGAAE